VPEAGIERPIISTILGWNFKNCESKQGAVIIPIQLFYQCQK